jgi:alpha-ketoglutaric semialdehyde dehydrogenase
MSARVATRPVMNFIGGEERSALSARTIEKFDPATGHALSLVARSDGRDVDAAVSSAVEAQPQWARETPPARGELLRRIAQLLQREADQISAIVAAETGKSPKDALAETRGAIEMGYFVAGEGRRLYGRTTTSAISNRQAMTVRQPLGVAGLIIAANTPIANVAWKVFPALICGNSAVLKPSEDAPETALAFARLAIEAGLPPGVLNVIQGLGPEAGEPLVADPRVAVVSFTGSTAAGRTIARIAGERLAKVCLELGGKNPFVVCDDADLEAAADAAVLSAYSNAGQRCAAGSRIIVFDQVYDQFKELLIERTGAQRVGPTDEHDFGPVINERQLEHMLQRVREAKAAGATVLAGGHRLTGPGYDGGYDIAPTLIEGTEELTSTELFGPITTLHRVAELDEAIDRANASPYGLTAAIWTASVHRGQEFLARSQSGVASVNGPTYGSEPHMPFGGLRDSGTGWREAGVEAIDVYSDLKTVYVNHDPSLA